MANPEHIAVGANHRTASLEMREAMFVARDETAAFYKLLESRGFSEAMLMSTCDRVEIHVVHPEPASAVGALRDLLAQRAGIVPMDERLYAYTGRAAMRQLLAIAASLDSLVVGEPQVLGQLKESHRRAADVGMVGSQLERRLQGAYGVAKRVRNETRIGERPVSIASAAVDVAREIHGDLSRRSGLLIGVGEAGELIAARMLSHGLGRLNLLHHRPRLAQSVAERLGVNLVPGDRLAEELAEADVLILAVGAGGYAVAVDQMKAALKARRRAPIFLVDAGIPPDADPAIDRLDDVFLYNLDHLEHVAMAGRAVRQNEADAAWAIVDEALVSILSADAQRDAVPAIAALRSRFEAVRQDVLAGRAADNADEATRVLVNRLLHDPSTALRALAEREPGSVTDAERLLERLFSSAEEGR
ncbi:MAG: glutamyl-tRNA reductase [Rhodospirillales bacterium]|nr:glutamyl-tRNA reductase [Rhodospirillales bacterium]